MHTNKDQFLNKFEEIIFCHKNCYIFGDLNIDLLKKNDTHVQKYLDVLNSNGYIPLNRVTQSYATRVDTRNSRTGNTVIDHISTDNFVPSYFLSIHDYHKSDHRLLLFNIKIQNIPTSCVSFKKTILQYNKIDVNFFSNEIQTVNNFDELIRKCQEIITKHTIITTHMVSKKKSMSMVHE